MKTIFILSAFLVTTLSCALGYQTDKAVERTDDPQQMLGMWTNYSNIAGREFTRLEVRQDGPQIKLRIWLAGSSGQETYYGEEPIKLIDGKWTVVCRLGKLELVKLSNGIYSQSRGDLKALFWSLYYFQSHPPDTFFFFRGAKPK